MKEDEHIQLISRQVNDGTSEKDHWRSMSGETAVDAPTRSGPSLDACAAEVLKQQSKPQPPLSDCITDLVGVTSYEYERYDRNVTLEKVYYSTFLLDPLEMDFSSPSEPQNWTAYTHPEGAAYFESTTLAPYPILTDVYVYEDEPRARLEVYIRDIVSYVSEHQVQLPKDNICLVLEFRQSGRCGYYFVNHTRQCLFWLDEFNAMDFLWAVRVNYEPSLIAHEMKSLYWLHNEYFPDPVIHPMDDGVLTELEDILHHAIGDALTSSSHTMPYPIDVLQKMLTLTKDVRRLDPKERGSGSTSMMYRFLYNFHHEYFLHLRGQKASRLNREQPIHPVQKQTLLMTVFSPLLLYGPEIHLKTLRKTAVDSTVRTADWNELLGRLTDDWKEFSLYATVLLNANVAFLAIQSVDDAAPPDGRSLPQRASYFSIMTSIGSIMLGLLLVRLHNTTSKPGKFLAQRTVSSWGLETLALMYSLPYALLMWGTGSFLGAFLIMAFDSHDKPTIVILSVCLGILVFLLSWCISSSFENQEFWYPWPFRKVMYRFDQRFSKPREGRLRSRQSRENVST
ncbi:hypothetical protein NLJ89_g920 [Agrocybe chaxingu]|uniref:Uncharacterized protein n=1 Tax=Agrocybe chaxingu TaxID=84603 RepID=A0A9W8N110_9AGAR|nr:hypothetical protein NLJ89_g920 [Agrocybe chaxingu]